MPIGATFRNDLLELVFKATAIANIADDAASGALTNLYVSLHTSDPGAAGTQTTNEATYGDYDRVAVARSGSGWDVTTNVASPVADITFPEASSGSETATYCMIGTAATSTGKNLFSGAVSPSIVISTGVTPRLTTASTVTLT
jgi:hypothetical protein